MRTKKILSNTSPFAMKKILFIALLLNSLLCFSQQKSVCEIVPLYTGKYPYILAEYENGKMGEMLPFPSNENYIDITSKEMNIIYNGNVVHSFQYTSIPSSGIEYLLYDEKNDKEVYVYIYYIKHNMNNKYFGVFIKYRENLEWVFTYKTGTQID